jgi:hypothetical protein
VKDKEKTLCSPDRKTQQATVTCCRRRTRIKIMSGRLVEWRSIATRHDRCAKLLLAAVTLTAAILFWL